MISRLLELPRDTSLFLFGARQTGKSTSLHSLFSSDQTLFYDLLQSEEYRRLSARPELLRQEILSLSPTINHVVIDEVQRIPELLNEVHWLIEKLPRLSFILTGSSARNLKRKQANLLAGRAIRFDLFPLMHQELGPQFDLSKALQYGTLPAIYQASPERAVDRLRAYVDTYLKEEIEAEAHLRDTGTFLRFLDFIGQENGNQINYSAIAQQTGTSYQTVKSYLQILEDTPLGSLLLPYQTVSRRRLSKQPKFYFFDTGVVRALTKRVRIPIKQHTQEFGDAFEHFIVLEMMRLISYRRQDESLSYYRSQAGAEVDLILESPTKKVLAIAIKAKDVLAGRDLSGLHSFAEICPEATLHCVSLAPRKRIHGSVTIWPWQEFFASIGGELDDVTQLNASGGGFDELHDEPDLYSKEDARN